MPNAPVTAAKPPQPLSADAAYNTLMQRVYIPAFTEKLAADYNFPIRTQEQLGQVLFRASQLRALYDQDQTQKQASAVDELTLFGQHMDKTLKSAGVAPQPQTQQLVKTAAARGAADPEIAHAVLSLASAGAQAKTAA